MSAKINFKFLIKLVPENATFELQAGIQPAKL